MACYEGRCAREGQRQRQRNRERERDVWFVLRYIGMLADEKGFKSQFRRHETDRDRERDRAIEKGTEMFGSF